MKVLSTCEVKPNIADIDVSSYPQNTHIAINNYIDLWRYVMTTDNLSLQTVVNLSLFQVHNVWIFLKPAKRTCAPASLA